RGIASNPSAAHRRSDLCRSARPFPGYHVSRARGHAPRVDAGGESRLTLTRRGKVAVSAAFVLFSVVPALLVGLDGGWGPESATSLSSRSSSEVLRSLMW